MNESSSPSPLEIREKAREAYRNSVGNPLLRSPTSSHIDQLFREARLYGRDAGVDFVETHLQQIVREVVTAAETRKASIALHFYGCGLSAIDAIATALRSSTGLDVTARGSTIDLGWED